MTVRTTMAELIGRARTEIGDPAGSGQTFDDQQIQDALDEHRVAVYAVPLRALPTYPGGQAAYLDHHAPRGFWEAAETLTDASYAPLTPATADRITGHWTFSTSQPSVVISGTCFDMHGAAADLLVAWAGKAKLYHSFSGDEGESQEPIQKAGSLIQLARAQRRRAWSSGPRIVRSAAAW